MNTNAHIASSYLIGEKCLPLHDSPDKNGESQWESWSTRDGRKTRPPGSGKAGRRWRLIFGSHTPRSDAVGDPLSPMFCRRSVGKRDGSVRTLRPSLSAGASSLTSIALLAPPPTVHVSHRPITTLERGTQSDTALRCLGDVRSEPAVQKYYPTISSSIRTLPCLGKKALMAPGRSPFALRRNSSATLRSAPVSSMNAVCS